jgi:hypothetical protein
VAAQQDLPDLPGLKDLPVQRDLPGLRALDPLLPAVPPDLLAPEVPASLPDLQDLPGPSVP